MAIDQNSSENAQAQATKKPYEKPSFRYEQVFVTTALSCGKTSPVGGGCASLRAS
ncbi:MAG TPA: hypothetical protein VGS27_15700 [Candidatus Sulfotelmatobacter sp.]|nr:hypothetical protein [Candidatus Sulfotelmatobacter sp.]